MHLFPVIDRQAEPNKQEEKHDAEWIEMKADRKRDGWKDGWIN